MNKKPPPGVPDGGGGDWVSASAAGLSGTRGSALLLALLQAGAADFGVHVLLLRKQKPAGEGGFDLTGRVRPGKRERPPAYAVVGFFAFLLM